uniref:Uncharacterized protein n=1 Tax=Romanomermis culicivorax TaxID=13658 RepID=A0A915JZD5_ROMCU
ESLRFAAEDENNAGHIKSIHIDAFTRYAQNFVRFVINKYTKDDSCKIKDWSRTSQFLRDQKVGSCKIKDWSRTSQFLRDQKVETLDFFGVRTSVNSFVKSLEEMDYLKGLKFGHIVPLVLDVIKNCQKTLSKLERAEKMRKFEPNRALLRHTGQNLRQLRMSGGRFFQLNPDTTDHLSKLTNLTHLSMLDMNLGPDESRWSFLKSLTNLKVLKIGQ